MLPACQIFPVFVHTSESSARSARAHADNQTRALLQRIARVTGGRFHSYGADFAALQSLWIERCVAAFEARGASGRGDADCDGDEDGGLVNSVAGGDGVACSRQQSIHMRKLNSLPHPNPSHLSPPPRSC